MRPSLEAIEAAKRDGVVRVLGISMGWCGTWLPEPVASWAWDWLVVFQDWRFVAVMQRAMGRVV